MKQLKQLVRNIIDPTRDLGHVDRHRQEKVMNSSVGEEHVESKKMSVTNEGEKTIPIDADAAVGRGPSEDNGTRKQQQKCENC